MNKRKREDIMIRLVLAIDKFEKKLDATYMHQMIHNEIIIGIINKIKE